MKAIRILAKIIVIAAIAHPASAVEKLYSGKPIKVLLVTGGEAHDYKSQAKIVPEPGRSLRRGFQAH